MHAATGHPARAIPVNAPAAAESPAQPLSTVLKEATAAAHQAAERHPFHAALFGARGPAVARAALGASLAQHLHVQHAMDAALRAAVAAGAPASSLLRPYHWHLPALLDDLQALGAPPMPPGPGAAGLADLITRAARDDDQSLLGAWYVLEGSTNGGVFIAKRVRDVLALHDERGTRFINPHGADVRARWSAWRDGLDALPLTHTQRAAIVAAADATFLRIADLMSDACAAIDQPTP